MGVAPRPQGGWGGLWGVLTPRGSSGALPSASTKPPAPRRFSLQTSLCSSLAAIGPSLLPQNHRVHHPLLPLGQGDPVGAAGVNPEWGPVPHRIYAPPFRPPPARSPPAWDAAPCGVMPSRCHPWGWRCPMAPCLHPSLQCSARAAPRTPLKCLEMIFSVQRTRLYGSFIFISPPVQMLTGQHSSTRHRDGGLPAPSTAQLQGRMDGSCRSALFAKLFLVAAMGAAFLWDGWALRFTLPTPHRFISWFWREGCRVAAGKHVTNRKILHGNASSCLILVK